MSAVETGPAAGGLEARLPLPGGSSAEARLRARLGIPEEARRVLVFSESSHWDTNWLQTSEEYFERRIEPIFASILAALEADPRRIYCVECVFFLKLYWERHPEAQARLRASIEGGQLRLLSSAFTTPDTLLPHPEAILRDFHLGQEWLRSVGLSVSPHTAYFPDNFGHSPHLPTLMQAVGVDAVAITRIDGMYFIASDYRRRSAFPLEGSTAQRLLKELRTLDFVWRDDGGAEVLCHWNAFTYFQGDMLAHAGIVRWSGHVAAVPWRTRGHIARRIEGFVRQLAPHARTPYLLCPIGMDFNDPIHGLRELLDRYNRERSAETGTWAVLAGLDDYFQLVGHHREKLPVLTVDPNPYWMGFYASRPELKQRPARIARSLLLAETLSASSPPHHELEASLREGWLKLVLMNHHDAITGTSPDRVFHAEQRGWLDLAETAASRALSLASLGREPVAAPPSGVAPGLQWWREGDELHVESSHHRLIFSERQGGCLTSLAIDGQEQLSGLGLDLLAFADDGGLWRLGHEYRGGRFAEVDRVSRRPARIETLEAGGTLSVIITAELGGRPFTRTLACRGDDPFLHLGVEGAAARRLTVTCRCELGAEPTSLEMDTLGGRIERPRERIHQPTFWPVPSLVSLRGASRTLNVGFEAPSAVSFSPDHALEWIVARNAPKERAFRLLPVLAHPIGGTDDGPTTHRAAIFLTRPDARFADVRRQLESAWLSPAHRLLRQLANSLVLCSDPAVSITAVKRADVGVGIIVRAVDHDRSPRTVELRLSSAETRAAASCTARERDLADLVIVRGRALVPLSSHLTTVRLIPG